VLSLRRIAILASVLASLVGASAARADTLDLTGFRFSSPVYFVHENQGATTITVVRSNDIRHGAQVRYIALPLTASASQDYAPVKTVLDFKPGQASASFSVPIVDHGVPALPRTFRVALFGAYPIGIGIPQSAVVTIINDDPISLLRDPLNPLGLSLPPALINPLQGALAYVDHVWGLAARLADQWRGSHPTWARMLGVIASHPGAHRFGAWDGPDPGLKVAAFVERASMEQPGAVPMIATYRLVNGHCGNHSDSAPEQAAYRHWMTSFAQGIGAYRAIVLLEMDSLITVGCLSNHGVQVRMQELRDAIATLTRLPRAVVYLDAGAADAVPAGQTASLLRRAGVASIQGFFLNSTHFDWTSREIRYGQAISRMTGGKHFIVNTGENGRGPLVPRNRTRDGNEVLCNPPGRGLGPLPTFNTGHPNVDAFAWTSNPGESGGACVPGAPPTGAYWPAYALELVRNADFRVR
jgi:endoglucanase